MAHWGDLSYKGFPGRYMSFSRWRMSMTPVGVRQGCLRLAISLCYFSRRLDMGVGRVQHRDYPAEALFFYIRIGRWGYVPDGRT